MRRRQYLFSSAAIPSRTLRRIREQQRLKTLLMKSVQSVSVNAKNAVSSEAEPSASTSYNIQRSPEASVAGGLENPECVRDSTSGTSSTNSIFQDVRICAIVSLFIFVETCTSLCQLW